MKRLAHVLLVLVVLASAIISLKIAYGAVFLVLEPPPGAAWEHGGSQTVSGSWNAGTKSPAAPIRWETFSGYSADDPIDDDAFWISPSDGVGDTNRPHASDDNPRHARASLNAETPLNENGSFSRDPFIADNIDIEERAYINFWHYTDRGTAQDELQSVCGGGNYQIKNWRTCRYDGDVLGPEVNNNTGWEIGSSAACSNRIAVEGSSDGCGGDNVVDWSTGPQNNNTWYHVVAVYDYGTSQTADAHLKLFVDETQYMDESGLQLRNTGAGCEFDAILFGSFIGNTTFPPTVAPRPYFSEIYIDNSFARVELCDSSDGTYANRTHCEIQIPTSWSATSISFTVNQGSFSSLSGQYVYVHDSSNSLVTDGGNDYVDQIP